MKRLLVIFGISLLMGSAFASVGGHLNIGDRAQELKDEGKTQEIHPSLQEIRMMHPEFLYHKRDKTLRQGVRSKRNSLKACVNCHSATDTQGEYIPINQQGQFCSTCHQKVGTSLDCFSCHRTTPKEEL
jgi:predicted CXXCH cytochrome family protein